MPQQQVAKAVAAAGNKVVPVGLNDNQQQHAAGNKVDEEDFEGIDDMEEEGADEATKPNNKPWFRDGSNKKKPSGEQQNNLVTNI